MTTPRKTVEMRALPVDLTPEELEAQGRALARIVEDEKACESAIDAHAEGAKVAAKQLKKALAEVVGRKKDVSRQITTGKTTRDVACDWHTDLDGGIRYLVRRDTGAAIEKVTLTDKEKQLHIGEQLMEADAAQLALWAKQLEGEGPMVDAEPKDEEDDSDDKGD